MADLNMQDMVQEILGRKSWGMAQVTKKGDFSEKTLYRIMGRLYSPNVNTYAKMMKVLKAPGIPYIQRV